jgi:thymidylate synthase ThyX
LKTFEGKNGIKATVVCDSICNGVRLTTMEVEYPRIIHSELMTHRMFSRNAASSRAIPFEKMLKQLNGKPVRFGANQAGMQDSGEHNAFIEFEYVGSDYTTSLSAEEAWEWAKQDAIGWSQRFADAGYHKQICNRLTETFQMIKVLISATEWDNFFWLRDDLAADPTLEHLAKECMRKAYENSTPQQLKSGEWHLPYVHQDWFDIGEGKKQRFYLDEKDSLGSYLSLEDAIKVSAARSAAVSYRNVDYSLEKSKEVYDRLVGAEKKHGSALEHQATPMEGTYEGMSFADDVNRPEYPHTWQPGISHMDRDGRLWSGNFRGFIQYRKLLPGENYTGDE